MTSPTNEQQNHKRRSIEEIIRSADDPRQRNLVSTFMVLSRQRKPKRNGNDYLAVVLCDRTGQIEAKMWDNIEQYEARLPVETVVEIEGYVNKFNDRPQIIIQKATPVPNENVDFGEFLPKTDKDIDQLWASLGEFVASMQHPQLRALLQAFMSDPQVAVAYRTAPAAKALHHAFIGGLLDHVVSLLNLCDLAIRNYPHVNRDLLFAGAFLHDIGKIHELSYARSFGYTTRGQLLGHMIIELEMLQEKIALVPGFSPELKVLLEHLIISHHGHYEFGSPKLPMFPEALMLHYLDDLDSKMESMRAQFAREAASDTGWAGYNSSLARPLLDSRKYLENTAETPEKANAAAVD